MSGHDYLARARKIIAATVDIRFNEYLTEDVRDRLALATVAAAIRPAAVFLELPDVAQSRLKEICIDSGLFTSLIKWPPSRRQPSAKRVPSEALDLFRTTRPVRITEFWVCTDKKIRGEVRSSDVTLGALLQYPACCVEWDQGSKLEAEEMFVSAAIKAVGGSPAALRRAFTRAGFQVELPDNFQEPSPNVQMTSARFPFVFHVACAACLSSDVSPTATLNSKYEALAQEISAPIHAGLRELGKIMGELDVGQPAEPTLRELDRLMAGVIGRLRP